MRRFSLAITGLAVAWALVITVSGGFVVRLGAMRVSSRSPVNPLLIALAAGALAWMLSPRGRRGRVLASDLRLAATGVGRLVTARWFAGLMAAAISVGIVMVGLVQGARVAGGSDAYGYVSQAEWWASGTFRFDEPLIREFAGRISREALVPLAYLPIGTDGAIVPMYAPGLPLTMAAVQRVGGREAVFYVVPLLGGLAIFATYLMGARLAGRAVGLSAAVLLATSPSFLFQLTAAPMSDVPVTAWWALALALVLFESRGAAFASGLAAGAAILTRPNLVPLALIPAALLLWTWLAGGPASRLADGMRRLVS
ncbi:MAG TPA: glycosyltransferase family 39 protein [Vicinamibacterales bacterium]|nr:glycosyltransferase family 39 protein [Vicinamibacterales bacterium]